MLSFLHILYDECHFIPLKLFVNRVTRRVPLVERELPTLPEHPSSPPVLVGSHRSIIIFMCMLSLSLSFSPFSFGRCNVKLRLTDHLDKVNFIISLSLKLGKL
jgi:hypothetical protein